MFKKKKIIKLILKLAEDAHKGQTRADGLTPFIEHPKRVYSILKKFGYKRNIAVLAAALLHDVIEDTDYTIESLGEALNNIIKNDDFLVQNIILYVRYMTNKFTKEAYPKLKRNKRKKKEFAEFATWKNIDLKALKIADITANLETFDALKLSFAQIYIMEEFNILRTLRIDEEIWYNAVNEINLQFINLILRKK